MSSGENQGEKLPVTTSSIVTEDKGRFMGLDGLHFLYVVGAFAIINIVFNNFLAACIVCAILYTIMKHYLSGKPDGFLEDMVLYFSRPKIFEHRPREKRLLIRKD